VALVGIGGYGNSYVNALLDASRRTARPREIFASSPRSIRRRTCAGGWTS
jgi:hypothetical protein